MHDRRSAPGAPSVDAGVDRDAVDEPRNTGALGRRAFIAGAAATGTALAAAPLAGTAHAVEPGAGYFQALDPRRLCDTRQRTGFTRVSSVSLSYHRDDG